MGRPSEDGLIARYFAPLAGTGGLGLADDAALLPVPAGHELVLTVDALVAGVHFLPDDPPASIARKALGVNLSDLAAKGAEPAGFLLALALQDGWTEEWLAGLAAGFGSASSEWGCPLLGGDTVRAAGPLTVSVTALGTVPAGGMVRRTRAAPGETVCVTGTIGDAVLGLALSGPIAPAWRDRLSGPEIAALVERYRHPRPRLGLSGALRDLAGAAMDVSDGLAGDLAKMMRAGGTGAVLQLGAVPFSEPARRALAADPGLRDRLVAGGDDYEVLFTIAPERFSAMARRAEAAGIAIAAIGSVTEGRGLVVRDGDRVLDLPHLSFQHF